MMITCNKQNLNKLYQTLEFIAKEKSWKKTYLT